MAKAWQLAVQSRADTHQAQKAMREFRGSTRKLSKEIGIDFKGIAKAGAVALGAGMAATIAVGVKELAETEKVMAQTGAVIKSTGKAANVSAKQVAAMAGAIAGKTGVDDAAIQSGQNMLLTFKGITNAAGKGNDMFTQTTQIMTDMAVAMGSEPKQAALQLGKALNEPSKGLSALTKSGVSFTAAEKEKIKALDESGDRLGAQKLMMAALNEQFAGSAAAYGKTLPGKIAILKIAFENMSMQIVQVLIPAALKLAAAAQVVIKKIEAWAASKSGQKFLGDIRTKIEQVAQVIASFVPHVVHFGQKLYEWRDVLIPLAAGVGVMLAMMKAWRIATAAYTVVQAALNVALTANPVGLVVLAIGGLIAVFVVAYKRSDRFRAIVNRVGSALKTFGAAVWETMKRVGSWVASVVNAMQKSEKLKAAFGFLKTAIKHIPLVWVIQNFKQVAETVHKVWGKAKELGAMLKNTVGPVISRLPLVWVVNKLRDWSSTFETIKGKLGWLKDKGSQAMEGFKSAVARVKDLFDKMWDRIKKIADKIGTIASKLQNIPGIGDFGRSGDVLGFNGSGALPPGVVPSLGRFASMARSQGLMITSGYRAGAVTADGNPSDHGSGHAIDVSNSTGPTPQMYNAAILASLMPGVKQVIYSPLGIYNAGSGWGALRKGSTTEKIHYNHVHIAAYARGGVVDRPHVGLVGEAGREAIVPLGNTAQARLDRRRVMQQAGLGGGVQIHQHFRGEPDPFIAARRAKMSLQAVGIA
jgi:hypothetical protein